MSDAAPQPGPMVRTASSAAPTAPVPGMRDPDASPLDRLLAEPYRFDFHQAVRVLHAHMRRLPADARPALRYRNTLSLAFPASEVSAIDRHPPGPADTEGEGTEEAAGAAPRRGAGAPENPERLDVTPSFMGLLGANGALPLAYSEQFARREADSRDDGARGFLDIFQHRAVTLFHEAWRKHRLPLEFEIDRRERYLPLALGLAGLGEPALRRRLQGDRGGVADDALAYYCGLLQRRAVSADHLRRVLADYFGVPVRIAQFVGRWLELDSDCQVTLGETGRRLGIDTVLGPRIWQRDSRVRVRIGPMTRERHRRFLPGGPAALALRELLTLVSGVGLEYEVMLVLHAAEVRGSELRTRPPDGDPAPGGPLADTAATGGPRLGWDSFLSSRPCTEDREEAAYHLHASVA